jgi:glycosyltransferase involved in cell wall biosynthesis
MKLLILTQKVDQDDEILGFFHNWILEFSKHCDQLTIICLQAGKYDFPDKIKVLSLGKETGASSLKYTWRFYKYIWQERKNYDNVFVHMNQIYVILGAWLWRLWHKKIALWYVHRQVSSKLRIAAKWTHLIFSVSKNSFRLVSAKLRLVGHGIDTKKFQCLDQKINADILRIISVGRITKIKDLKTLILAASLLNNKLEQKFVVDIIGGPVTAEDKKYLADLYKLVKEQNLEQIVNFTGAISNAKMADIYCQSDILVNLAPTGGVDKVVLEAMSCKTPVLVANQSFAPDFGEQASNLIFIHGDVDDLASKLQHLIQQSDSNELGDFLRKQVVKNHELSRLINKIVDEFQKCNQK